MADWSSLPCDLVRRVADCHLTTNDVDCYVDMRAVCHNWRSAIAEPCPLGTGADLPFHRRLFLRLFTAEKSRKTAASTQAPTSSFALGSGFPLIIKFSLGIDFQLKFFFIILHQSINDMFGGLVVLVDTKRPHAAVVVNPMTGSFLRYPKIMGCSTSTSPRKFPQIKAAVGGADTSLVLWHQNCQFNGDTVWSADPTRGSFRFMDDPGPGPLRSTNLASMAAHEGHVYMITSAANVYEIVWDDFFTYQQRIVQRLDEFVSRFGYGPSEYHNNFLVHSDGELILVRRPRLRQQTMEVFRVDADRGALEPVNKIASNHALFLGERCIAVNASRLPSIDSNCIYYGTKDIHSMHDGLQKHEGIYRYDLADGSEERISGLLVPESESYLARPFSLAQVLVTYCAILPHVEAQAVCSHASQSSCVPFLPTG
uniref:KIB1-4 beta-propeller domain-containing protein n=1 Tax=Aegilops tauschii TaxID=37682 RepID=M8BQS1_AEGTA